MKQFKKFLALVIVAVMTIAALSVTAFAEGEGEGTAETEETKYAVTVNVKTPELHTYEIYQIFTGTPDSGKLTSLKYGQNFNFSEAGVTGNINDDVDEALLEAIKELANSHVNSSDQAIIDDFTQYVDLESGAFKTVPGGTKVDLLLPAGYYVIKDTDGSLDITTSDDYKGGKRDDYTLYMFQIVSKDLVISAKSDGVESEKKNKDINDSTDTDYQDWTDSADHEIGDVIPYKLTFKLPAAADYKNYETYKVRFLDDMCPGLTLDNTSVKIYFGDADTTGTGIEFQPTTDPATKLGGTVYEYVINDLKTFSDASKALTGGETITIKYKASLNEHAEYGYEGNPNDYWVEFSNNPNAAGTGKTPKDRNIVFTYKAIFNKVDENGDALTGADFDLYKILQNGDKVKIQTSSYPKKIGDSTQADGVFQFLGLDDGNYVLVETCTPPGYNPIGDIKFTITASHILVSDNPYLDSLSVDASDAKGNTITMSADTASGTISSSIENRQGAVLPTTGGIGTTLFYVIGAILVLGAGVVLVTRRRMSAN